MPTCHAGEVRVLNDSLPRPGEMGFDHYGQGRVRFVEAGTAPPRDVSQIDCAVYGWAEHHLAGIDDRDWAQHATLAQVLAAFRLTNRTGVALVVERRNGGLTLRRPKPGEPPSR